MTKKDIIYIYIYIYKCEHHTYAHVYVFLLFGGSEPKPDTVSPYMSLGCYGLLHGITCLLREPLNKHHGRASMSTSVAYFRDGLQLIPKVTPSHPQGHSHYPRTNRMWGPSSLLPGKVLKIGIPDPFWHTTLCYLETTLTAPCIMLLSPRNAITPVLTALTYSNHTSVLSMKHNI